MHTIGEFTGVRPVPAWLIIGLYALLIAATLVIFDVVIPGQWTRPIAAATGGLIHANFLVYAAELLVIGWLLRRFGGLRCQDLGLHRQLIVPALAWTAFGWATLQVGAVVEQGDPAIHGDWSTRPLANIGEFVTGQLLANALFEEIFYRAFLVSQLTLLFSRRLGWGWSLFWAAMISQVMFSVMHIPVRLHAGMEWDAISASLISTWFTGMVFTGIYLLTGNVLIAVGLHALHNRSPDLFEGCDRLIEQPMLLLFAAFALFRWWRHRRIRRT